MPARHSRAAASRHGAAPPASPARTASPRCAPSLQAAELCEELGDSARAVEWLTRLLTRAPHDAGVLTRLGALHAK